MRQLVFRNSDGVDVDLTNTHSWTVQKGLAEFVITVPFEAFQSAVAMDVLSDDDTQHVGIDDTHGGVGRPDDGNTHSELGWPDDDDYHNNLGRRDLETDPGEFEGRNPHFAQTPTASTPPQPRHSLATATLPESSPLPPDCWSV